MKSKMGLLCAILLCLIIISSETKADFKVTTAYPVGVPRPVNDGNIVVWYDNRRADDGDIYGYNLDTKTEFPICTATGGQYDPRISGNIVVWQDHRNAGTASGSDIYGYNLDTQTEFSICTATGSQWDPKICGNIVVWQDSSTNGKGIYGYNIDTHTNFIIDSGNSGDPDVGENFVVWTEYPDVYGYELSTKTKFLICSNTGFYPAVSGNTVVWHDNRNGNNDIYGYNLDSQTEFPICINTSMQQLPAISGNIVVWEDDRNVISGRDIYGYNLLTGREFLVSIAMGNDFTPSVSGTYILWSDYQSSHSNIFAYGVRPNDEPQVATEITLGVPVLDSTAGFYGSDETVNGLKDYKDAWHSFTPAETSNYTISSCGSSFDTTLAVFDEDLNEATYNEDYCGEQSKVVLKGKAGKQYYIRIAGYDGATGDYVLSIIQDGPEPLQADINYDGKVNLADLGILATEWLAGT